ncbi:Nif3-like dinuclear metal center hexameric protein [Pseudodesulfovibrio sp.]|uniref:Nif3-like dinuclear metal center hexameric protein n=1 Tax=unclassified Pseudodesulfovibrio TaxID=2661612 RepID=UPI003B003A82
MKIQDILTLLRSLAPEENQSSWDNSGVQVAGVAEETAKVAVCLEPTPEMVERCLEWGAGVVVTHHPLYMKPKPLSAEGMFLDVVRLTVGRGAWLYAAHTSLDTRPGGPAFWLGQELGLVASRLLEPEHRRTPIEASFFCEKPIDRATATIWADNPRIHSVSQTQAGEVRIVCDEAGWSDIAGSIEFSLGTRPLFYLRPMTAPVDVVGFGEVGELPKPMEFEAFAARLAELTGLSGFSVAGPKPDTVAKVAYCGGSGASLVDAAADAGADVFVTGDMKYHPAVEARTCVVDVGHFAYEEEMMRRFAGELSAALADAEVAFFTGTNPFWRYEAE